MNEEEKDNPIVIKITQASMIYIFLAWTVLCILTGVTAYLLSKPTTYIAHYTDEAVVPSYVPTEFPTKKGK